jgi:hypothetical protein
VDPRAGLDDVEKRIYLPLPGFDLRPLGLAVCSQSLYRLRSPGTLTFLSLSLSCLWLCSPCGSWPLFQFINPYTVGRTPWTGTQSLARPLPTHRTTQTQNKRTHIHASSGIRTHDPSVHAGEDGSCLRPRSHCDRPAPLHRL